MPDFLYDPLAHGYTELFVNLFMAAGVPIALGNAFTKQRVRSALILVAEMLVCAAAMEFLLFAYFAIFKDETLITLVCATVVTLLYSVIVCRQKPAIRVMRASVYLGLSGIVYIASLNIGLLISGDVHLHWLIIVLHGVMIFFIAFFLRVLSVKNEMRCSVNVVTAGAGMGVVCFVFSIIMRQLHLDAIWGIIICFILMFTCALLYYLIGNIVRRSYDTAKEQAREIMASAYEKLMHAGNENIENISKIRHDIKNHCAVMKEFIAKREYKKLDRYFANFTDSIEAATELIDCGNATLDAIIGIAQRKMRAAGVQFNYKIAVPKNLGINDVDLCSLVLNLLDNAVEYCAGRLSGDRKISLEITLLNKTLIVKVANDILPEDAERALTLKTNKKNESAHGFGSKIVASIAESYNGSICYEIIDGKFTASAMLFTV